ncbi:sugar kinase [Agromyces archimandritae]|uniref:Sugar kinase n=2 Tax=Agromyces archimandritae TaxID=2781962 RepID=A0A975FQ89_9MICO|nr:sugar kinase [Agromyces archimandritae]
MVLVAPERAEPLASAEEFRLDAAGAEANVASHLVRLGRVAAWAGRVGADALGERLVRQLAARGLGTAHVERDPDAPTGLYVKDPGHGVLYYRRGSAASRMSPSFLASLPAAGIVHHTGITPALSAGCDAMSGALAPHVHAAGGLVSFDVNHRPALWAADAAAPRLRELAAAADLVFVGLDEAARLWGAESADEVRRLLPEPAVLVVKDGPRRATEFDGGQRTEVPAIPVDVVEEVGAGDAFAAGYLAARLSGADAAARLSAGHAAAVTALAETSDFPRAAPHGIRTPSRGVAGSA